MNNINMRITRFLCLILLCFFFLCAITPAYSAFFVDGVVINGLSLEKVEQGKTLYLIRAGKASFGNKRIGFFSTALIKLINLEDVDFKLYSDGNLIKSLHFDKAVYEINSRSLFDGDGNLIFHE